jgi:hypothetical protein
MARKGANVTTRLERLERLLAVGSCLDPWHDSPPPTFEILDDGEEDGLSGGTCPTCGGYREPINFVVIKRPFPRGSLRDQDDDRWDEPDPAVAPSLPDPARRLAPPDSGGHPDAPDPAPPLGYTPPTTDAVGAASTSTAPVPEIPPPPDEAWWVVRRNVH